MNRIQVIDSIVGHIKSRFGNELDRRVYENEYIYRSVFWPGGWGNPQFCGLTFNRAMVNGDVVALGKKATVQDVLDCLERCAQEWRVEQIGSSWCITSRGGVREVGPVSMSGKNFYDEAVKQAAKHNKKRAEE